MIRTEQLKYKIKNKDENNIVVKERTILDDVNIHIEKGEFVAILGHNGSGKTTFAKHLNALLLPDEGSVFINGEDTKVVDELWKIRKQCGMVFQNPDNQLVGTNVEEDVAFGPENLGIESEKIVDRVNESLEKTGMFKFRKKSPNHLSGGQKQRVAIASSLAMKPDCIVLDEPTAMLDPQGRNEVMDIITKLNKEDNMTIILITHHMEEAARAKRVVVMEGGKPILDGSPQKIFMQISEIKRLQLDIPQIMDLSYKLWEKGKLTRYDVLNLDEFVKLYEAENSKLDDGFEEMEDLELDEEKKLIVDKNIERLDGLVNNEILRLENVSLVYEGGTNMEVCAVDDVSLSIEKNEFIGIIGHTGSGKSTILQLMNGLIKPTKGRVFFEGKDIYSDIDLKKGKRAGKKTKKAVIEDENVSKRKMGKRNSKSTKKEQDGQKLGQEISIMRNLHFKVGLVFQYPESQLFEETVIKDVMFGPLNKGLSEEEARKAAEAALNFLGMDERYYDRSPFELSGGEMRKVAIAGVIAMEPEIIILDEPVAGLDPANRNYLLKALKSLQKEKNKTIVMVSHDMEDVARYSERLIVVDDGKIRFDDDTRSVFGNVDELKSMGLAATQVTMAMDMLQKDGYAKQYYGKKLDVRNENTKDFTVLTVEEAVNILCESSAH